MTVRPYTFPSPEQVRPAASVGTGGYWTSNLTNALASQGPSNAYACHRLLETQIPDSYQHRGYGTVSTTITEAQAQGVGIGRVVGSIPVIVNGVTYWCEVGAASTVPRCVGGALDAAGIAWS